MRVTHVVPGLPDAGGGISRVVTSLVDRQRAHEVSVLTTRRSFRHVRNGPPREIALWGGLAVHSYPTGALPPGLPAALAWASRKTDVFHFHMPYPALAIATTGVGRKVPWVISYHNDVQADVRVPDSIKRAYETLVRRTLAHSAAIIVGSSEYASSCRMLDDFASKVRVVEYAVNQERFHDVRDWPYQHAGPALFVGRLAHYKGLDVLLDAVARTPNIKLNVAGEGPESERLRRKASDLGLDDRVSWLGYVPDARLGELYARSSVLVLPSTGASESYGLVLLEAFCCGIPAISTSLPGVRSVNSHERTGLVVPPDDSEALSRAVMRLTTDPHLAQRLSDGALREGAARSESRMVDSVNLIYAGAAAP